MIVEATKGKPIKSRREQKGGTDNVRSLYELFNKTFGGDSRKQKIRGDKGTDSSRHKMVGTHGKDKVLKVPPGVTIMDDTDKKVLSQLDQVWQLTFLLYCISSSFPNGESLISPLHFAYS